MLVLLGGGNAGRAARPATAFGVAAGFVTVVVSCLVATWLYPPGAASDRLFVLTVVIAGFAAMIQDVLAALVTAGLAWPFYLGFLVDRYGELRWHGSVDVLRLALLAFAALIGTALGRWVIRAPSVRPVSPAALRLGEVRELGHRRVTRVAGGDTERSRQDARPRGQGRRRRRTARTRDRR